MSSNGAQKVSRVATYIDTSKYLWIYLDTFGYLQIFLGPSRSVWTACLGYFVSFCFGHFVLVVLLRLFCFGYFDHILMIVCFIYG